MFVFYKLKFHAIKFVNFFKFQTKFLKVCYRFCKDLFEIYVKLVINLKN